MFNLPELAEHIIVIAVTIALMGLLLIEKIKPVFIFFGAVLIFLITGVIESDDYLKALSNESILSIFLLIFITYGVRTNFSILEWMDKIFGNTKKGRAFIFKMSSVVAISSSFLNNTPIVALFMPYVYQWSKKRNISPSKLLIPLSYAAMAGGMITVIGTSTNLVLQGLVEAKNEAPPGFLDYLLPGLLVTAGSVLYLVTIGYSLLPNKEELLETTEKERREYMVNVNLSKNSKILGQTVKEAGLTELHGIDLFEIIRHDFKISPIHPQERVQKDDTLVFVGDTDEIVDLFKRKDDFKLPKNPNEKKDVKNSINKKKNSDENNEEYPNLIETVIPANSELIGRTLKTAHFNKVYGATVIGIHRNGSDITKRLNRVRLRPGDLLLLVPGKEFKNETKKEDDLYVVSVVKTVDGISSKVLYGFLSTLGAVILLLVFKQISLFLGLLIIISFMMVGKMMSVRDLKEQFSVNLFIVLVGSLAFSTALINSGVAEMAANGFMSVFESMGNRWILIGIFVATLILTSFVTHVAAVAIIFPIAYTVGSQLPDMNLTAVFVAIAFAASASFHTPFSYQTNMMVYGPGGYTFKDFIKVGMPLTIIYSILAIWFIIFYYNV